MQQTKKTACEKSVMYREDHGQIMNCEHSAGIMPHGILSSADVLVGMKDVSVAIKAGDKIKEEQT